ncbi:MAG: hypothetical protein KatS3mg024_0957 [Armatimonadota bacterium]|nr:MAG: hypothetical protein KatS3mg024_0957 [Armatimonadota bacterium]
MAEARKENRDMRDLIVTVGTSLLGNWRGSNRTQEHRAEDLPDCQTLLDWVGQQPPEKASAETHTLFRLPLEADDRIHLLHSSTEEGRLCAHALERHFSPRCRECRFVEIRYLSYSEPHFRDRGLRELLSEAFKIIREARRKGRSVEICATGGFKPELAYLNVAGLLAKCPVHYVHERFASLITLPPLPVDWAVNLDEQSIEFLQWLDSGFRNEQETEARLKQLPHLRSLVSFDDEGCSLSPAGLALLEAWRERTGFIPEVHLPHSGKAAAEKIDLSKEPHHRPSGFDKYRDRIANLDFVTQIFYRGGLPACEKSVAVLNAAEGSLRVRLSDGDYGIELIVHTTATDDAGAELAAKLVREALDN